MSKLDKESISDTSSKTMLNEIDEQLDMLAGLIVSFLQTVDEEDELYFLVEKLCDYDDIIMDKLSFAIKQILEKSYIKGASKDELFEYINSSSGKPKIKRKCKNELIRRGIKIQYISEESTDLNLGRLR